MLSAHLRIIALMISRISFYMQMHVHAVCINKNRASDAIQAAIWNYQGNALGSWSSRSYHHFRRIQKLDIDISNNVTTCSDPNKSLTMIAVPPTLRYAVAVMIRHMEDKARVCQAAPACKQ